MAAPMLFFLPLLTVTRTSSDFPFVVYLDLSQICLFLFLSHSPESTTGYIFTKYPIEVKADTVTFICIYTHTYALKCSQTPDTVLTLKTVMIF